MEELKSNDDTLDRLSELPDSLILEILSFLEMRDVVKTTLLSKRWKYLWITIPCLKFKELDDPVQISNFVSRAMVLWRGTHLRKFSLSFYCCGFEELLFGDIDSWVLIAKERKVEELCIKLYCGVPNYYPPQCLYECSSIGKLKLHACYLQIRGNVQWDRLNSLNLSACLFSDDVFGKVFSSSPSSFTGFRNIRT